MTVDKIQEELTDLVDKYFPKIKPNGKNPGRGGAIVIVGVALSKLHQLETEVRADERHKLLELLEDETPIMTGGYAHDEKGKPIAGTLSYESTGFNNAIARNNLRAELRQALEEMK
jgi:hypothetical protein